MENKKGRIRHPPYSLDKLLFSSLVYSIEDILQKLTFRFHTRDTSDILSIFEYNVSRVSSDQIFSMRLRTLGNIHFRNSKCISVL